MIAFPYTNSTMLRHCRIGVKCLVVNKIASTLSFVHMYYCQSGLLFSLHTLMSTKVAIIFCCNCKRTVLSPMKGWLVRGNLLFAFWTRGIPESRFETPVVWFGTMQKAERMGFKNQNTRRRPFFTNIDIQRYGRGMMWLLMLGQTLFCSTLRMSCACFFLATHGLATNAYLT